MQICDVFVDVAVVVAKASYCLWLLNMQICDVFVDVAVVVAKAP